MNCGKTWLVIMAAALCLLTTVGAVSAADKAQVLKQQTEKLLETLATDIKNKETVENVNVLKQAGLSYQPSLVVPVEGVIECKDQEQLRVLMGMYNFDANYALLFGRKQEFASAYELRNDIPGRLNLMGRFKFQTFTSDEIKNVLDNPNDPGNRDLFAKYVSTNVRDMLQAAMNDPEMLDLLLDFVYGTAIEGAYVSCKLALAAGVGEKLIPLFNEQAARLDKMWQALSAYAEDPELDALVERSQREPIMKPIIEIMKAKKGNLEEADVKEILSIIEPERNKVALKCK